MNLLGMHSIPLSMSLIMILNSTGANMDQWGTSPVTDVHLDIDLLTTTLRMWPAN